jgi:hypothetical protein
VDLKKANGDKAEGIAIGSKCGTNVGEQTRSRETDAFYATEANRITEQCRRQTGKAGVADIIDWLIDRKNRGEITKRTWRVYKQAVLLKEYEVGEEDERGRKAIERLKEETQTGARIGTGRKRCVGIKGMNALNKACKYMHPETQNTLQLWIEAGIITGLRPSEWKDAGIEKFENVWVLHVKNAKNTHGRSHGDMRHIAILEEEAADTVKKHIRNINDWLGEEKDRTFRSFYRNFKSALERSLKKANCTGEINLYATRHQFKTDAARKNNVPKKLSPTSWDTAQPPPPRTTTAGTARRRIRFASRRGGIPNVPSE